MKSILAESALIVKLCAGALRLAEDWFSWDSSVNKTISAIWGPGGGSRSTSGSAAQAGVVVG